MIYQTPGTGRFEIPVKWWAAAGMQGFDVGGAKHYRSDTHPKFETKFLPIASIFVPARNWWVPDFGEQRMVCVLQGIRQGSALPPVEVLPMEGVMPYRLYDGRHRLCASIAVGFPLVPAVVTDMDT